MKLHIQSNPDTLSQALAAWMVADMEATISTTGIYTLVLSGGSTPKKLYELLATEPFKSKIPWQKIHLFWGDERYVPFSDERNNGRMAYEAFIKSVSIPEEQIHYMDTTAAPEASARSYETLLHGYFDKKEFTFDLVLLGMGDDGHTLSLFPGSPVIEETKAWVLAPFVADQDMYRITLTPPVVNQARRVAFMVTGEKKAETLQQVVNGPYNPLTWPSQIIHPGEGALQLFADEPASRLIR